MISDDNNYHKVLIVSTIASVIDQFNRNNIKILQKLNWEITVAANFKFGNTTSQAKTQTFYSELVARGIEVIDIPIPRTFNLVLLLKSFVMINKLVISNNYSLIHCHTPIASFLLRFVYFLNTKINRENIIYTAHGFHFFKGASISNWLIYYPYVIN